MAFTNTGSLLRSFLTAAALAAVVLQIACVGKSNAQAVSDPVSAGPTVSLEQKLLWHRSIPGTSMTSESHLDRGLPTTCGGTSRLDVALEVDHASCKGTCMESTF